MKAIDIIDALTRVGSTEGTGLVETPANVDEMPDWLRTWFGEYVALDRELKPGTRYVYSYVDRLWTPRCEAHEDCIMEVDGFAEEIYLYEIE